MFALIATGLFYMVWPKKLNGIIFLLLSVIIGVEGQEIQIKERALYTSRFALEANEQEQSVCEVAYHDRYFMVHPGVFSPKIFPDTLFFADHIKIAPGESFLEVGSGTGLIAVVAALTGAGRVVAIDINSLAVKNTIANGDLHGVSKKLTTYYGDVFDPLPLEFRHQFDTIWWNVPFMHIDREDLSDLEKALYDPNYRSLRKYLAEAKNWLKPNGRLLIGFSETHGHRQVLEALAEEYGWSLRIIAENSVTLPVDSQKGESLLSIQLYEAIPK